MRTLRTVSELRAALKAFRAGDVCVAGLDGPLAGLDGPPAGLNDAKGTGNVDATVGLVPTMGALHEGHLSLIRRAREQCDLVVVSLFVNPSQFNDRSDLEGYPRHEASDASLAEQAGAQLLFAPAVQEVYPEGFATSVEVHGLTERLEGASRGAAHFRGVSTVVCKLLNMVGPNVAYFGAKDAQQVLVIKRLVSDLNLPVEIEVCPTVREPDGLALSSRNALLSIKERAQAKALHAGLSAAQRRVSAGERSAQSLLRCAREAMRAFAVEPEYLELVDQNTLEPLDTLEDEGLLVVAARVGSTRLIDNLTLQLAGAPQPSEASSGSFKPSRKATAVCNV